MKKLLSVISGLALVLLFAANAFASHVDYLSDLSAEWVAQPNRLATTSAADAAAYNPAGTAFMKDGLYLNISTQSIFNFYHVEVEDGYDQLTLGPISGAQDKFKSHKASPVVPNLYLVYKQDDWSAFTALNVLGGGGSLYFNDGLPMVNNAIQKLNTTEVINPATGTGMGFNYLSLPNGTNGGLAGTAPVEVLSMIVAQTVGGAYALNDMISVSASVRYAYSVKKTKVSFAQAGLGGKRSTLFDVSLDAWGVTGIIGCDIKPIKDLNIGITLEGPTMMKYKVKVDQDASFGNVMLAKGTGMTDDAEFQYDLPARAYLGAEYQVTDSFKAIASFIAYFTQFGTYEKRVGLNMATGAAEHTTDVDTQFGYEVGAGFEWEFAKNITWSLGCVWDYINVPEDESSELNFKNNCFNVGTGLAVKTDSGLKLMVGVMRNFYPVFDNENTTDGVKKYKTSYHKVSYDLAVGVEYKVF